mgnify:CR=1 FL=1
MRYAINCQIDRLSSEIVRQYADLAVADICDALGRNAALPSALKPLGGSRMLGSAYTVNLPASENLLLKPVSFTFQVPAFTGAPMPRRSPTASWAPTTRRSSSGLAAKC